MRRARWLLLWLSACSFRAPASSSNVDAGPVAKGGVDGAVAVDAAAGDAGSGAPVPPTMVTLSETVTDDVTPGDSLFCAGPGMSSNDEHWFRVFWLGDFGVQAGFQVAQVTFLSTAASHARGIKVRVGTYTGAFADDSLDLTKVAKISTASVDPPDSDTPQSITVPIDAQIPALANVIIEVESPDLSGGKFVLGATTSAETAPGYFACGNTIPQSDTKAGAIGHFVIDVVGTAQPLQP